MQRLEGLHFSKDRKGVHPKRAFVPVIFPTHRDGSDLLQCTNVIPSLSKLPVFFFFFVYIPCISGFSLPSLTFNLVNLINVSWHACFWTRLKWSSWTCVHSHLMSLGACSEDISIVKPCSVIHVHHAYSSVFDIATVCLVHVRVTWLQNLV